MGKEIPVIGGPVFGITGGMLIAMLYPQVMSTRLNAGIRFTSKKLLQFSIILLGFEMNLYHVIQVGGLSLYVMLFTLTSAFLTAILVSRMLKMEGRMTTLIAVGTAICGGSAIAATAPVIQAKDEEVAHAISTIFLFNIAAVFIFPAIGHALGMSDMGFGMWAGTAINDTSSVVASGTAWSNAAGNNTALAFATIVKLTRTLMIVPITLVLAVYWTRRRKLEIRDEGKGYNLVKIFPWFVIGFLATSIVNTYWGVPILSERLVSAGKFMIVMAMVAIGLNTNLKKLLTNGGKPLFLGLCCWISVALVSILVQQVMGTM
jgi:uncharacterized integral membrane protein (TIGR00698 family)